MKSIYDLSTGLFTGVTLLAPPEQLARNIPPGCGVVDGAHDHRDRCVDLATGQVVDYQPPAPADDEQQTWAWDAATRRWRATKTSKAIAADVRSERNARLAACDWVVTAAIENATTVPAEWRAYRAALRDLSEQAGFPLVIVWPVPPAALLTNPHA